MYNTESLRRKISEEGLQQTITELSSENLPINLKSELEDSQILVNGYVNISLIYSLV